MAIFADELEGWTALSNAIASGAIHNADERSSAAKRHPDTRTEILDILKAWIKDPISASGIVWMHGPIGVGKTAIAQSIAEWAYAEGILGGSFFFLRGNPEQEEARYHSSQCSRKWPHDGYKGDTLPHWFRPIISTFLLQPT